MDKLDRGPVLKVHLLEVRDSVTRFRSDGATIHAANGISYASAPVRHLRPEGV